MTEESRMDDLPEPSGMGPDVATLPGDQKPAKLSQIVQIEDAGPCRKRIRVEINRGDIDARFHEHYSKLTFESQLPGFRPGKAPRRLIVKRAEKEVASQVKGEVLLASLQQLGEEHNLAPLSAPDIDPSKVEIPPSGPMIYQFEVEVRPEFEVQPYRGLKLRRPVRTFTPADIAEARGRILREHSQIVPKEQGTAELGDLLTCDIVFKSGDQILGKLDEQTVVLDKRLAFKDVQVARFSEQMHGAKAGETRTLEAQLSGTIRHELAGRIIQAVFVIKDVKMFRYPEITDEFVQAKFNISSASLLDEVIRSLLERNLEYTQRQYAREEILKQLLEGTKLELPQELLRRQYDKVKRRRAIELRNDGLELKQIAAELSRMDQNVQATAEAGLRAHFVLQKIAEIEKIDVSEEDLNDEIARIAEREGESPRKTRAKLEKDDALDSVAAEMVERKVLDLIIENAEFTDFPLDPTADVANQQVETVETSVVPDANEPVAAATKDGQ
jgi:trigger factor